MASLTSAWERLNIAKENAAAAMERLNRASRAVRDAESHIARAQNTIQSQEARVRGLEQVPPGRRDSRWRADRAHCQGDINAAFRTRDEFRRRLEEAQRAQVAARHAKANAEQAVSDRQLELQRAQQRANGPPAPHRGGHGGPPQGRHGGHYGGPRRHY
ncbi:hypothetical protein KVT40_002851 [Elsinoe batatas]|uniref:Uncharacterized protein n=1 Tax=Elsinoe batatas TaxID=2601811 RepID=A0A8K0L762_9PEZI|nr:hypothetical protein KVT40_002851 [Elsinoe batatas]